MLAQLLPKSDPRFKKWRLSLKKRPPVWNKGKNKNNNTSVKKISLTMKLKKIDNFASWRQEMINTGKIIKDHPPLKQSTYLSTLIGLILGDGNINKFPRVEKLTITLGTDKPKLIEYAEKLVKTVFNKNVSIYKQKGKNCVQVYFYQKQISKRLGIPMGSRKNLENPVPKWIKTTNEFLIACLKGLYEAEASLCIHKPSYTYNFAFHNLNPFLLNFVEKSLLALGFHPEVKSFAIRLRKKNEVEQFKQLINFRQYS